MSNTIPTRLLSPRRRRIYPNALTGTHIAGAGKSVKSQRGGLAPGESDPTTWDALERAGWSVYMGPAQTDPQGFVVKGSDPERGL